MNLRISQKKTRYGTFKSGDCWMECNLLSIFSLSCVRMIIMRPLLQSLKPGIVPFLRF